MDTADIVNRFRFHAANAETAAKHTIVRERALTLAFELNDLLPDGREKSQALSALELVMFHSNAAIARA